MTVTGVSSGTTTKQILYNLSKFYLKRKETDIENRGYESGSESSDVDDDLVVGDEYFTSVFTLSKFTSDIMKLAVENFAKEYELETKKALGKGRVIFFQEELNKSTWTDISSTESLLLI